MSKCYPGAEISPLQAYALAEEYWLAAHALKERGRPGHPVSRCPFRLCAIHAIELYLDALLLKQGCSAKEIRSMLHRLEPRVERALAGGLALRKKTSRHIRELDEKREYMAVRYAPELALTFSQVNRLTATLDQIRGIVSSALGVEMSAIPRTR